MACRKEPTHDLIDDSIIATPMPQACSTVDKRIKYKTLKGVNQLKINEENTMKQGIAAIEEMKKKLNIFNNDRPSHSVWNSSNADPLALSSISGKNFQKSISKQQGDSTIDFNDHSLARKDGLNEESGFTNLQNISDLERDEMYCRESWGFISSDKINMSLTAVENSKIVPPDFMPMEDSLFADLQSYNNKEQREVSIKAKLDKDNKQYSVQDVSLLKHDDTTQLNREMPSIDELLMALKGCEEDANPRMIMDQVLKAVERKTTVDNLSSTNFKNKIEVTDSVTCSGIIEAKKPMTYEECLVWGNVLIGDYKKKILHIIYEEEKEDIYKVSIEGNEAFKMSENCSKQLSSDIFLAVKDPSIYEIHVLFRPNQIGQATGFIKIESQAKKTVKKVCLNGFGGKGRLLFHNTTYEPLTSIYLALSKGLKTTLKLENSGSTTLFFYISSEILEEYIDIKPKLGLIKVNEIVPISVKLILRKETVSNCLSSIYENYFEVGKFKVYYGDESTRLRLHNVCVKKKEEPGVKRIQENFPFLTCNSFPSSDVDIGLLDDSKGPYVYLAFNGTYRTEIDIKVARSIVLQDLENAMKKCNTDH